MKENSFVARRRFLKWAGLTATIGPTFGFTSRQPNLGDSSTQSKYQGVNKSFEAVKVSSDRVITDEQKNMLSTFVSSIGFSSGLNDFQIPGRTQSPDVV